MVALDTFEQPENAVHLIQRSFIMTTIAVLTGAGISAESGLATFRDSNGLWANHRIEDVCTPEAWERNPQLVLDFYNQRRAQAAAAQPNAAHIALAQLQQHFPVHIITQNVDDLHERAGSRNVLHLHGQLNQARSSADPDYIVPCTQDQTLQDKDPQGNPMRPHIVWFGESVPLLDDAAAIVRQADVFLIIGTSLQVYPANTLAYYTKPDARIIVLDPNPQNTQSAQVEIIRQTAAAGVPALCQHLIEHYG